MRQPMCHLCKLGLGAVNRCAAYRIFISKFPMDKKGVVLQKCDIYVTTKT